MYFILELPQDHLKLGWILQGTVENKTKNAMKRFASDVLGDDFSNIISLLFHNGNVFQLKLVNANTWDTA